MCATHMCIHMQMAVLSLVSVATPPSAPPESSMQTLFITELADPNGVHAACFVDLYTTAQPNCPQQICASYSEPMPPCGPRQVLSHWLDPLWLNHNPRVGLGSLRVGQMARDMK